MSDYIAYAIALGKVRGLGPKKLYEFQDRLANVHDTDAAYLLLEEIKSKYNKQLKVIPSKDEFVTWTYDADKLLQRQEEMGIHSIAYPDNDYPPQFKQLDNPPLYFFYKGNQEALYMKGIAVIGTREVTDYTRRVGEHIGKYIAEKDFSVISGLAIGSDTAGHKGCLDAGGTAVAIVATPLDQVYPKQNTALQNEILETGGCVISEYPIGTPFVAQYLVARDRLQSGLANGVFVVATGEKGGTWHAINEMVKLKRPLGYFNYKKVSYVDSLDLHTQGMDAMYAKGAMPISSQEDFDEFLDKCSYAFDKDSCQENSRPQLEEVSLFDTK